MASVAFAESKAFLDEIRAKLQSTTDPVERAASLLRKLARLQHRQTPQCCRKSAPSVAGSGLRISGWAFGLPHADRTDRGLAPRAALSSCPIYTHNGPGHPRPERTPMSPNVPATRELPAIEAAMEPHVDRIREAAADAFAPNTRRAYRTAWAAFARWADGEGFQALPAAPAAVAAYLAARSEAGRSLSSLHLARQAIRAAHIGAGEADPAASEGVRRVLRGLSRQRAGQGGGGVRRPRSPPKRWPRSEPPPATAARAPPTGRNPPKRPGCGEPWTSPSPPSCGTPCSGAPKRPRSNGPMSSSGRMDRDGSWSAARRRTRKAREPSSTSGRGPPLLSGRSAPGTRIRTPACSASAPDAPWPAASPPWQGPPGSKARSPDTPPASGWPAISWPPGPPSSPSRSRVDARPLRPGRAGRTRGRRPVLRGVRVPRPSDPRRKAAGSPPDGLRAGGRRGDVRAGPGRGRHPSSLAGFGPDRSDRLHVYR